LASKVTQYDVSNHVHRDSQHVIHDLFGGIFNQHFPRVVYAKDQLYEIEFTLTSKDINEFVVISNHISTISKEANPPPPHSTHTAVSAASPSQSPHSAITATVTGQHIQQVGFRAMIQKMAIMYNIAGEAKNNTDGTVSIVLQGDTFAISQILCVIKAGNKKSSHNNQVANKTETSRDPNLKTFTVDEWTSTSRKIVNKYNLVFHLRSPDIQIKKQEAGLEWNTIVEHSLNADDREKFMNHLNADD